MSSLLISDWPLVSDPLGCVPSCYEMRYSEAFGLVAIWSPECDKHVAFKSAGNCTLEALQIAVALLDKECGNLTLH